MNKPLSHQVADLENRLESLSYENEQLKVIIYRMIAENGNKFDITPYSSEKAKQIGKLKFSLYDEGVGAFQSWAVPRIKPNKSENEL